MYSSNSLLSRGTGSRLLIKLSIIRGVPYRLNKSSKWRAAGVKNGSTTLTERVQLMAVGLRCHILSIGGRGVIAFVSCVQ